MGERGVSLVTEAIRKTGHIFRPNEKRDFGIDGQVEIVVQGPVNRHAAGCLIAIQIKCGPTYLKNDIGDAYALYCSKAHANYWEGHSLPVIVVLCDPYAAECYWATVDSASLVRTPEGAKVIVPKANKLSASGAALVEIAQTGKLKVSSSCSQSFIFPLNNKYGLSLDEEELGALCGEVSLALNQAETVAIEINFEIEAFVANEADVIRSSNAPTADQRKRLVELEDMRKWFSERKKWLSKGIRILLNEDYVRSGYIDITDFSAASQSICAFVHYFMFERVGQDRPHALVLNAFPDDGSNGLVANIFLDDQERNAFLSQLGTKGSTEPLKWPGYMLGELGGDLMLKRGLPAVVTALLFFLDRNNLNEKEFFSGATKPLYAWRLGLA